MGFYGYAPFSTWVYPKQVLCAPLLAAPQVFITNVFQRTNPARFYRIHVAGWQIFSDTTWLPPLGLHPHFPYGQAVAGN